MDLEEPRGYRRMALFEGKARIGEVIKELAMIRLKPEDFSSPVAMQMALSRIYDALIKSMQEGLKKRYVAEVSFEDSLGNPVVIAVDLGENPPPVSSRRIKARVIVEVYEEEGEEDSL